MMYWNRVVDWIESKGGGLYILKGKTIGEKRSVIDKILNTK